LHAFSSSRLSTPEISTLSLHDALPIWKDRARSARIRRAHRGELRRLRSRARCARLRDRFGVARRADLWRAIVAFARDARHSNPRSEEHTSELQSRVDIVCRLLLEKKKI